MQVFFPNWQNWLWSIGIIVAAVLLGYCVHLLVFAFARRFSSRTSSSIDDFLVRYVDRPSKFIFPVLAVFASLTLIPLDQVVVDPFRHFLGLLLIAGLSWLLIALVDSVRDLVAARYELGVSDNLSARQIQTQVQILRHIAVVLIIVLGASMMLMTFPNIRNLGQSLFASAGVAALVAGFAARSTLTSLIAGIQVALTQPIRLDDVVIVEGEWGWIEEIRTTFVVVRVWDLRRLVVPLSYFIETPFQNWTRRTADLLGTVFLYTDYTVPVEEIRAQVHRILESSPLWDGKVWGLQVTNTSERTMELRALMSAPDAPTAWNLRCHVREELISYMQLRFPESLPKTRAELSGISDGGERTSGESELDRGRQGVYFSERSSERKDRV